MIARQIGGNIDRAGRFAHAALHVDQRDNFRARHGRNDDGIGRFAEAQIQKGIVAGTERKAASLAGAAPRRYSSRMILGFIGSGKMATALARGVAASGAVSPGELRVTDVIPAASAKLAALTGAIAVANNRELASAAS